MRSLRSIGRQAAQVPERLCHLRYSTPVQYISSSIKANQHLKELGRLRHLSCDAEFAEHRKAGGASARAPLPPAIFYSGSLTSWSSNWLRIAIRAVWTKDNQSRRNRPCLARRVFKSKPFHCIRSIRITSSLPACYSSMMARSIESISSS
jgi:hypothetical protein